MRNSAKLTGLVALVAIGGAIGVNCSSNKGGSDGTVKIAVVNAQSEGVLSVNYLIHAGTPVPPGPVIPDVTGVINVSDPNATPSVDHSFPASNGDVVTLTATATGGVICTGTSAPFNLAAGGVAQVSVTITCPNGTNNTPNQNSGDIVVTGTFVSTGDNCPLLTSWVASPLQTSGPGGTVNLDGTATDSDGDTLAYSWSASKGSFTTPFPAATGAATYACPAVAPGTTEMETLSLSVNDNKGCTATLPNTVTIACVGVAVVSGAAGAPGTGGAAAGAPGTGGAAAGAPGTGGAAAGAPGTGGGVAGTTGTGGMVTTGGNTGTGGIDMQQIACEQTGVGTGVECFGTTGTLPDGVTPLPAMGCLGFTGTALQQCNDLQGCLDSAACQTQINAAVANDPGDYPYNDDATPCLCGIGPTAANPSGQTKTQCLGGPPATGWAGVCQAQFAAAAGGAANVAGHFFDRAEPIGIAVNLLTCDVDASCIGL
jgi:hypothetical protein